MRASSPASWAVIFLGGVIFLLASYLGRFLFPALWEQFSTRSFQRVQGKISSCEITGTEPEWPTVAVRYGYQYGGRNYEATRWRAHRMLFDRAAYQAVCRDLLARRDVDVFVNPDRPQRATLEPAIHGGDLFALLILVWMLSGAVPLIWFGWRGGFPGRREKPIVERVTGQARVHSFNRPGGVTLRWLVFVPGIMMTILGAGWGMAPPLSAFAGVGAFLATVTAAFYGAELWGYHTGRGAIIVDGPRRSLILPKSVRRPRVVLDIDSLGAMGIYSMIHSEDGRPVTAYAVAAVLTDGLDEGVIVLHPLGLNVARELAMILAREISALRCERPVTADLEPRVAGTLRAPGS